MKTVTLSFFAVLAILTLSSCTTVFEKPVTNPTTTTTTTERGINHPLSTTETRTTRNY